MVSPSLSASSLHQCGGCGKGPRDGDEDNKKAKMLCCSRCKNAWYHDKACQRAAWPLHKKECVPIATAAGSDNNNNNNKQTKSKPAPLSSNTNTGITTTKENERELLQDECPNKNVTGSGFIELPGGDQVTKYIVPTWSFYENTDPYIINLTYHDTRENNPITVGTSDGKKGRLEVLELDLHPLESVDVVPQIAPPQGMIVAKDCTGNEHLTRKEEIAMILNAFNVRCFMQKNDQVKNNMFVLLVEYDVRENETDSTLCLWVTTLKDGLEDLQDGHHPMRTTRRRFLFHAPKNEASYLPDSVCNAFSPSPNWDIVRGLLPMGLDFIMTSPTYKMWMEAAADAGRKVEMHLFCRSPIMGEYGATQTTDMQITKMMMQWMQSFSMAYGCVVNISRLPDGCTGEDVDNDPETAVVATMRRLEENGKFGGQPLLVTDEERCVPKETHAPEAFRICLANVKIAPRE